MNDETRPLEDWLIDNRWPDAYDLARAILASDWLAEHDAKVRAEALREYADEMEPHMAEAWGGSAAWFTTGEKVAAVVADWLRDWAEEE